MSNPFDHYKDEVEYNYILRGKLPFKLKADTRTSEDQKIEALEMIEEDIESLLTNEDYMKESFEEPGLGRVYAKLDNTEDYVEIVFGISVKDADQTFNIEDLKADVIEFMHCLDSNVEGAHVYGVGGNDDERDDTEPTTIYLKQNGDIIVEVEKEPKNESVSLDNIDRKLVSESKLTFQKDNLIESLVLTDDGMVEYYKEDKLQHSNPFSKLSLIRECKSILQEGFILVEQDDKLDDLEATQQNIEQGIEKVDQIQELKDELEDKVDKLMNESNEIEEQYVLGLYTSVNKDKDDYEFDVLIKNISENGYYVADNIEEAMIISKEQAELFASDYNKSEQERNGNTELRVLTVDEAKELLTSINDSKEVKEEDTRSAEFPSSEFTQKILTSAEIKNIELQDELSIEQVGWIIVHFGSLETFQESLKTLATLTNFEGELISIDEYISELQNEGGISSNE